MDDSEFDWHFPFDIPRRGQREVCKRIIKAYSSGKKYVVLQAPTGSGKSVISYTVASYFASSDMKTFVLTSQKGLQDQYVNDFADTTYPVETVKGAANYRCDLDPKRSCAVGVCKNPKAKKIKCNCPYVRARTKVYNESTVSILNYTYFLNMSVVTQKQRNDGMPEDKILQKRRGLLVVDECIRIGGLVTTINGKQPIETIKTNDEVLSYNIETKQFEFKKVLNTFKNLHKSQSYDIFLKIELDNGKTLQVTPNHKIYTSNRGYIRADELTENDDIMTN